MKLFKFTNFLANTFLCVLLFITLTGAIALLPANINGVSNSFIKVIDYLILIAVLLVIIRTIRPNSWHKMIVMVKGALSEKMTWCILFFFMLIWQLSTIYLLSGTSTWDWMFLARQAYTAHPGWPWPDYGSNSPNNLFLLKVMRLYYQAIGQPTFKTFMYALNLANVFFIDLATWLLYRLAKSIWNKKTACVTLAATLLIFTLVPFFVIPYSDTVSFLTTTLLLISLRELVHQKKNWRRIVIAILIGVQFTIAYFIKPSTVILFLAALLVLVIWFFRSDQKRKNWWAITLALSVSVLSFVITQPVTKNYLYYHNGILKVDSSEAFPMSHFAAMGITGNGDFSGVDRYRSVSIKDPKKRNEDAWLRIHQRFEAQGRWMGYQRFLVHKQIMNSADGSLGWGHEDYYLKVFDWNNKDLNRTLQRRAFVDSDGIAREDRFNFRLIQQIIWIIAIIMMLFSLLDSSLVALYLKIATIGFFTFLLVFEGGRSRYLIQFLPVLFLLVGMGYRQLKIQMVRFRLVEWKEKKVEGEGGV
ncbi:PMT family glycosyltransferase ArnT/Agl22 [Fructobacillus fructosus]|uniref:glycosyltransferase family 39 protein n=1 Tax=Fructobacillus fructosus TaxID=1631 RepID=UPI002D81DFF1|nr:PMT family glycosyltransferase ArnT/Agl22 [Fructobacillus fructosus]